MSDLEAEYRLDYFEEEGFERKECPSCGAHFWTRDADRELCGEPPCADYSFIDDPGFPEPHSLSEMREAFLSFFEEHGHERIDPYPVAANRWRDDVLLTQASIYDFQPLVTSGQTPPPANPLTISQPCIRMQDIDNVGKTGRHTMAFEMMAHHAFNTREDAEAEYAYEGEVYWKDETVRYCDELFESLGADLEEITYIEDPWVGGGNAGPAIEVIYKGAELATLVFMCMERDPDGDYEMKDGHTYSFMDTYIVDTGYGLERWTWMSQGTATVYEAIYPDAIDFLKENAGIEHTEAEREIVHRAATLSGRLDIDDVDDVEAARGDIADRLDVDVDRLRELVEPLEAIYAIADHSRALAYMFGDGIVPSNVGTGYLARMVLRRMKRLVDEAGVDAPLDELVDMQAERLGYENRDTIREIVRSEERKYRKTLERDERFDDLPETEKLFYDDQGRTEFEAVVLDVFEREEGYDVVLDQTMFYPEGGGQPADRGQLTVGETTVDVTDVQEVGGVVLHRADADPGKGEFVRGQVDGDRRDRLRAHHTATHLIGHAAREVLGDHVRQAGAQKGIDSSRLDVRHYDRITRDQVKAIERVANELVRDNVPVRQEWPDRNEAEAEHGFDLYQGGVPPGTNVRLVHVGDADVQACAGTHVDRTGQIGAVKVLKTEPVQDGVERIVFAAAGAAVEATQRTEDALYDAADALDVDPLDVPETAERFFEEWKARGKEIESLKEELAAA
ncbi:alanine--tRNA ligase, partial [Halorubrum sp. SD626R]|uniref:alanine--tRNA ligase-related protein n=1 Tax=Halorubrum sp. SD626R TaxID=1419722 RepID=UPI0010F8D94E